MARWLRDSEDPTNNEGDFPIAPTDDSPESEIGTYISKEKIDKDEPKVDSKVRESIDQAWKLANEGHLVQAEVEFSKVIVNQPGVFQLLNYAQFLSRIGRLDQALAILDKVLEVSRESNDLINEASALVQQAHLLEIRGDLDRAENMYKKALEINEKLGRLENMAKDYGNLGKVLETRGDLDRAEEMYKKALKIATSAGFKSIATSVKQLLRKLKK